MPFEPLTDGASKAKANGRGGKARHERYDLNLDTGFAGATGFALDSSANADIGRRLERFISQLGYSE